MDAPFCTPLSLLSLLPPAHNKLLTANRIFLFSGLSVLRGYAVPLLPLLEYVLIIGVLTVTPSWMKLPSLFVERYGLLKFDGYCCLEDSRLVIHMSSHRPNQHYFFCFDGTANTWTHRRFSGLPFTFVYPEHEYVEIDEFKMKRLCGVFSAHVQKYALFLRPSDGKLSVFDFGAVFELLNNPDVAVNHEYAYPYFGVAVDEPQRLKEFDAFGPSFFLKWNTYQLGNQRFCCLGFFQLAGELHICICKLSLNAETCHNNTVFSARNDVAKVYRFGSYYPTVPFR